MKDTAIDELRKYIMTLVLLNPNTNPEISVELTEDIVRYLHDGMASSY